jgi:hypothetical protein
MHYLRADGAKPAILATQTYSMSTITPPKTLSPGPSQWPNPSRRHLSPSQLHHSIHKVAALYGFVQ